MQQMRQMQQMQQTTKPGLGSVARWVTQLVGLLAIVWFAVWGLPQAQAQTRTSAASVSPEDTESLITPVSGQTYPEYLCRALSPSPVMTVFALSASGNSRPAVPGAGSSLGLTGGTAPVNLTQIVVSSGTATATTDAAHGLRVGHVVEVRGASASLLNRQARVATVPSSTTFTFSTSAADATYNSAGLEVRTNAPRAMLGVWAIVKMEYSGGVLVRASPAQPAGSWNKSCTLQASYF